MTLSERLAAFVASTRAPQDVRENVRARILDVVGVSLAALPLATSRAVIEHARALGGVAQATAIGSAGGFPAPTAAFVNGVLAHSLDYDDTHLPSILHPSASVVPACLAAAEHSDVDGPALIDAIAVGLEVCVRLGMAGYDARARQSAFFERGQHATSICGAVAGAAACARLLGLDAAGIAHAIGIAVSMGAGVIEGNRTGGTVKRIHCGLAAQSAVTAAMLATRGITGPPTALEGRFGFFHAWLGGTFDATPLASIGATWEVPRIFFKPYPANHFTHALADAAIALRARLRPDDVERFEARVPSVTTRTVGDPIERKRAPGTGYEAQFSAPYVVAAALLGGSGLGLGLEDFTDELAHAPERRDLMARIDAVADPELDAIYPMQFPAVLRAHLRDGTTLEERVLTNRGGPERPLTTQEIARKFHDNAAVVLPPDAAREIERAIERLDDDARARDVLAPTADAKEE